MQNLRLILGAEEMWDRLKAPVWVRFHAFFSFDGLPAILVLGCFNSNPSWVSHFLIWLYFAFISFCKISNSLRTSTATLIFLKTFVVGHTTWQLAIRGLFSLQAPGLATLNQALTLCLVRWLIPTKAGKRELMGLSPHEQYEWLLHSYHELQGLCRAELLLWKLSDALLYGSWLIYRTVTTGTELY